MLCENVTVNSASSEEIHCLCGTRRFSTAVILQAILWASRMSIFRSILVTSYVEVAESVFRTHLSIFLVMVHVSSYFPWFCRHYGFKSWVQIMMEHLITYLSILMSLPPRTSVCIPQQYDDVNPHISSYLIQIFNGYLEERKINLCQIASSPTPNPNWESLWHFCLWNKIVSCDHVLYKPRESTRKIRWLELHTCMWSSLLLNIWRMNDSVPVLQGKRSGSCKGG